MLEQFLKDTATRLGTELQWGWDERWCTALMVLQWSDGEAFLGQLEHVFAQVWKTASIDAAPSKVQTLAENFGGLRSNQALHTVPANEEIVLFAAIWPWVGNSHMSVRLGVCGGEETANQQLLRSVFAPDSKTS